MLPVCWNPRNSVRCISRTQDRSVSQRMSDSTGHFVRSQALFVCRPRLSRPADRHRWRRLSYDRPLTRHRNRYISGPHSSSSACLRRLRTSRFSGRFMISSKSMDFSPMKRSNSSGVTALRYPAMLL